MSATVIDRPSRPLRRPLPRGATLVEPLVATAVVGVLAAGVLPGLADLSRDAQQTALRGLAGTLASVAHAQQGACLVAATPGATTACVPVRRCADLGTLLVGGWPAGVTVQDEGRPEPGLMACRLRDAEGREWPFSASLAGG
jgi:type II secretory pathway pseudopilin PulG